MSTRRSESPSAGIRNGGITALIPRVVGVAVAASQGLAEEQGLHLPTAWNLVAYRSQCLAEPQLLRTERVGLNPDSTIHQLSDLQPNPSLPLGFSSINEKSLWFHPCDILLPEGWYADQQHGDFLEVLGNANLNSHPGTSWILRFAFWPVSAGWFVGMFQKHWCQALRMAPDIEMFLDVLTLLPLLFPFPLFSSSSFLYSFDVQEK